MIIVIGRRWWTRVLRSKVLPDFHAHGWPMLLRRAIAEHDADTGES